MADHSLQNFFDVWEFLRASWGIERPFMDAFLIPSELSAEIDSHIFFDLMHARRPPGVQRISVQSKHHVQPFVQFQAYVCYDRGDYATIYFQNYLGDPFNSATSVAARPSAVVASVVAYFHLMLRGGGGGRCRLVSNGLLVRRD